MTKTGIPEFITGALSTLVFLRLWPLAVVGYTIITHNYVLSMENNLLAISIGTFIFISAIFGLISVYCFSVCLEKLYYYLKPFAKEFIKW